MRKEDLAGYAAVGASCCIMMHESKISINTPYNGNTALHYAVSELYNYSGCVWYCYTDFCKRSTVSYLLAKGANPAARNSNGETPFEVMEERFVREEDRKTLKEAHEKALEQRRLDEEREERERLARFAKQQEEESEQKRVKEENARKEKEAAHLARLQRIEERSAAIAALEHFLRDDAGIDASLTRQQAESLCIDHSIDTVAKLCIAFVKGSLEKAFVSVPIVIEDQERISQALFTVSASKPTAVWNPSPTSHGDDAPVISDCFLTHDWEVDEFGRSNHERVSRVNKFLQAKGLVTWFDEDRMEGNVRRKMTEGIDNAQCVVVFITSRYRDKVNDSEERDNCRYEFTYAVEQKGPQSMIPVVMEGRMLNARRWKQELGAALDTKLYVSMVSDDAAVFDEQCKELYTRIRAVVGKTLAERAAEQ